MKHANFFGKRYLIIICVGAVLYSTFLIFSDLTFVYERIINFDLKFLPLILITIFASWMLLFVRWNILTKKHEIHIKTKESLLVYLSGFSLSISPVKSGELIKSIILKNNFNIKRSKTVPIILLERFYDILGTFAKSVDNKENHTYIVSGDKDLMQLVDDSTSVYTPGNKFKPTTIYNTKKVLDKWKLAPDKIIDYLG